MSISSCGGLSLSLLYGLAGCMVLKQNTATSSSCNACYLTLPYLTSVFFPSTTDFCNIINDRGSIIRKEGLLVR